MGMENLKKGHICDRRRLNSDLISMPEKSTSFSRGAPRLPVIVVKCGLRGNGLAVDKNLGVRSRCHDQLEVVLVDHCTVIGLDAINNKGQQNMKLKMCKRRD